MYAHAPSTLARSSLVTIPRHVAIIMDGNGRWATKRQLPRLAGHRGVPVPNREWRC
jgi:undecaprenyl diphosphate synthase